MKKQNFPCVLTIAGTDPTGGAGIQADIKTISANHCYAASVITALVAQNTMGVKAIQEVPTQFVKLQLESVFTDLDVRAVKIGMLHNEQMIETIANYLVQVKPKIIVLDPVMLAKNGCELLKLDVIHSLKRRLLPMATIITPNLFEAEQLLVSRIRTTSEMEAAAKALGEIYDINVLVKGGHLADTQASDVLYLAKEKSLHWFTSDRITTKNTHGTGCTLSSAIAAQLALGLNLINAIIRAKKYLSHAIQAGSYLSMGHGCGPVDHFYFLEGEASCHLQE